MTITLAAVYAPIGFVSGLTGALFREFAFTLAGAVIVSGIIALTLSPMMASKLLKPHQSSSRFGRFLDRVFDGLRRRYEHRLHRTLDARPVTLLILCGVIAAVGDHVHHQPERAGARGGPGHPFQHRQGAADRQPRLPRAGHRRAQQGLRYGAGEGARVPDQRHGRRCAHGDRGHPVQALGGARAHSEADIGKPAAKSRRHRRRLGDLVPATLPAGRRRRGAAGAVRGADDGRLSAARAGAGRAPGGSGQERHVHLHGHGLEVSDPAGGAEDRSRQGQPPGREDVGYRRLAGDAARRQLRQPFQSLRPQLSGHPAGAARVPADRGLAASAIRCARPRAPWCPCRASPRSDTRCSPTR